MTNNEFPWKIDWTMRHQCESSAKAKAFVPRRDFFETLASAGKQNNKNKWSGRLKFIAALSSDF
jgi:hypothetical protein